MSKPTTATKPPKKQKTNLSWALKFSMEEKKISEGVIKD